MINTIRLNHHDDRKEDFLLELIPLLRQIESAPDVVSIWVQRHWIRGPHLRITVHTTGPMQENIRNDIEEAARVALRKQPSVQSIDVGQWEKLSITLGEEELVPGPYVPIEKNNTFQWENRFVGTDTFVRDAEVLEVKGALLSRTLPLIMDSLKARPERRFVFALYGMLTLVASYPDGGAKHGYFAYLSHWKEFLHWNPANALIEDAWSNIYKEQADLIDSLLASAGKQSDPTLALWDEWVRNGWEPAIDLARRDLILPYPHAERLVLAQSMSEHLGRKWGGGEDRQYSDFHTEFRKLDFTKIGDSDSFSAFRFLINCQFEILKLMDISPYERYTLAYLLTRAVEHSTGTTWMTSVAGEVAKQGLDPSAEPTLPWRGK